MAVYLPILTFHTLENNQSVISLAPRVFAHGVSRLHAHGFRTVRLAQVADTVQKRLLLPKQTFVITFDDGYRTVYTEAFPILQRCQMSATVFLSVGVDGQVRHERRLPRLGGREMLSWREIREMHRHGIDFGAHTLTHPDLTRIARRTAVDEICRSKDTIEDVLGASVTSFAYPYGRFNESVSEIVRRNYVCACSDRLGFVTTRSDPHALERIDTYYLRTERLFDLVSTGFLPWYIYARAIPRRLRRSLQGH